MTKYEIDDDHEWADGKDDDGGEDDPLGVNRTLYINDERDSIERYNGLQWWFVFGDDGRINGVDLSHYCPGPGHTDPMGFVAWNDVPAIIRERVLDVLNAESVEEAVDVEATEDAAEVTPP